MTFAATRHDVDGYTFDVYDTGGRDETVYLILHGVGLSHRPYELLARHLSRDGRVIALDLPGFGSTAKPSGAVSVEEYARLIAMLVKRLDVTSFVAIGHSMGAQFALELALLRPSSVSHLVMIGPVADSRRHTAIRQSMALVRDSVLEPLTTNAMVFTDYLRCGPRWYFREVAAMLDYPTHEHVKRLTRPLLIIRGANDPIAVATWCTRLTEIAGGGVNVTIPRKRHVVVHTAADDVAQTITSFVAPAHGGSIPSAAVDTVARG